MEPERRISPLQARRMTLPRGACPRTPPLGFSDRSPCRCTGGSRSSRTTSVDCRRTDYPRSLSSDLAGNTTHARSESSKPARPAPSSKLIEAPPQRYPATRSSSSIPFSPPLILSYGRSCRWTMAPVSGMSFCMSKFPPPISLRIHEADLLLIRSVASRHGLTVADYLRFAALAYARDGLDPSPTVPVDAPPKEK